MAAADVPLSPLRSADRRTAAADTAASEDDDLVDPNEVVVFPSTIPSPYRHAAWESWTHIAQKHRALRCDDSHAGGHRTARQDISPTPYTTPLQGPIWQRPYYWQLVGYNPPLHKKASHIAWWFGSKVFYGMEFIGAIVADLAGMNQSKYQCVLKLSSTCEPRTETYHIISL
mmetsp:Transcript_76788/g.220544  ORF Transcript_76788/g.220544 Transcript_76788/m.220544 type:complete len:172 (+) Transcript_76788:52-567(+)